MQQSLQDQTQTLITQSTNSQEQATQMLEQIQHMMQQYLPFAFTLSAIFIVLALVNMIHKWRVQSAIMNIDRNVQKLVDLQVITASIKKDPLRPTPVLEESEQK